MQFLLEKNLKIPYTQICLKIQDLYPSEFKTRLLLSFKFSWV